MGELLDKAFNDIMAIPREQVTYEVLRGVVEEDNLLNNSSGWKQVRFICVHSNSKRIVISKRVMLRLSNFEAVNNSKKKRQNSVFAYSGVLNIECRILLLL